MNSIEVRQAFLADLDDLSKLFDEYRQFYGKSSDLGLAKEFLRARFNHGESTLFVAHAGSAAVGFVVGGAIAAGLHFVPKRKS